jgi:hypothetical protein
LRAANCFGVADPALRRLHWCSMAATLMVERNSPDDAQQREIIVLVDGEWIAELTFGKSVTQEIPPGDHTLTVDNTWNKKSVAFTAQDGETIRFKTKNTSSRIAEFFLMIFGAGPLKVSVERI